MQCRRFHQIVIVRRLIGSFEWKGDIVVVKKAEMDLSLTLHRI